MRLPPALLLLAVALFGCSEPSAPPPPPPSPEEPPVEVPRRACVAPFFDPSADGARCVPRYAHGCPAGTMPKLGESGCVPVGWTGCPAGFATAASGWGCEPAVAAACTGATRAAVGSAACVPVGDCGAPFPPANATLFVDDSYASTDATHFKTLSAALRAARSGAVIAVEAGTYTDSMQLLTDVTVVGRCAAQVKLVSGGQYDNALAVSGGPAAVRGFTFEGFPWAVDVRGAALSLADVVIEGSAQFGVTADFEAEVTVERSVIRDTGVGATSEGHGLAVYAGSKLTLRASDVENAREYGVIAKSSPSAATLERSVVRGTRAPSTACGAGVEASDGAAVTVTQSVLANNAGFGAEAYAGRLTVTESSVGGTSGCATAQFSGVGLAFENGATGAVTRTRVAGDVAGGVLAHDPGTVLTVSDSSVDASAAPAAGMVAGFRCSDPDRITIERTAIVGAVGAGILRSGGALAVRDSLVLGTRAPDGKLEGRGIESAVGVITLAGCSVAGSQGEGVELYDTGLTAPTKATEVSGLLVLDTRPLAAGSLGRGLGVEYAWLALSRSALVGNAETGLFASHARVDADDVVVANTGKNAQAEFGHGAVFRDASTGTLRRVELLANAAVGAIFAGSTGQLSESVLADNAVGLHAQGGSHVEVVPALRAPATNEVVVSSDTVLAGNASNSGTGELPLPPPRF